MKPSSSPRQKKAPRSLRWLFVAAFTGFACLVLAAAVTLVAFYLQINRSLPSTHALKNYHPPVVTSVYAADGSLIAEYFNERRYLVSLSEVPQHLTKAFLAAEDVRFYEHGGVDFPGIVRAMFKNIQAGEIVQGGSTITQQVVKSLLLTPERTFIRKIKEGILAYRIDHSLTKDEILHLYLNQIYFGSGAYGVEAAARTYFDKHVGRLTVGEAAMLAGLPKAPSRFSPFINHAAAVERQHYVLQRMAEVGFISESEARKIMGEPLHYTKPKHWTLRELDHFTEEVRRQLEVRFGRDTLYKEGLSVTTTMDIHAQMTAEKALDQGLRELDKRHRSYRGVHLNISREDWPQTLKVLKQTNGELTQGKVVAALVKDFDTKTNTCGLQFGDLEGKLPYSGWEWAQVSAKRAAKMFRSGDLIRVRLEKLLDDRTWTAVLEQDPGMEGALMSMEPETGRVTCMVGGRDFEKSQFNRCTQAIRQPGSSFKPIIYSAAIDKGYTELSTLVDSPLILDDNSLRGPWKPANYDHQFWGPITLRRALVNSRNVVTVKLLSAIGVDYLIGYARRMGIASPLTPTLALALGASGVTLQELMTAYSAFANMGDKVEPYLIEKIVDRSGRIIEQHQVRRETVIPPQTAYIMTNLLQGVVEEGTGTRAKKLGRPAAGKTGTTNEMKDAWFIGYTPEALTGVWVGYDDHTISLGKGETGGRAACPIWLYYMEEWMKEKPLRTFPIPEGIVMARVNAQSGYLVRGDEGGGSTYAAFAGSIPVETRASREGTESQEGPGAASTPGESFFKSDLF